MLGVGIGLLVLAVPLGTTGLRAYLWGGDPQPGVAVPVSAASRPAPAPTTQDPAPVPTPSGTPSADPSPVPTPTRTAPPAAPPTPSVPPVVDPTPLPGTTPTLGSGSIPTPPAVPAPPPAPVLLGPDGRGELTRMVDRYCDRHVGGASWADPRGDGRWECQRLLLSSRTVDLDTACRDTYGDGAYADNTEGGDAFGWRCYRR